MDQNHLELVRDVVIAMSHGDRSHLMRHDDGLNIGRVFFGGFGQSLDNRTMVGSGIRKQVADSF